MAPESYDARLKAWEADDNFLFNNYNIYWNSPFVLSFMFGTYTDPNNSVEWTSKGFAFAVGLNILTASDFGYNGGWWGYVSEGLDSQKDLTLGMIYQNLYSQVDYTPPNQPSGKCGAWDWVGNIVSGGVGGLTTYAFLVANPELAVVVGLVSFFGSVFAHAASSGCL